MSGVPFLTSRLGSNARVIVEVAWGADLSADASNWTWTDITSDVRQADGNRIVINPIGSADWLEQAQPACCTFQLDNTTGSYSKGPQSSNYPYVRRSTPVRVQVTLNGITKYTRFFGFAAGFTPSWDTSCNLAIVTVTAYGKLRQLEKDPKPIRNALTRYHLTKGAAAVWPFDDGHLSTQAANAVANGSPMLLGATSVNFGFDVSDDFPAMSTAATLGVPSPGVDVLTGAVNAPLSGLLHVDVWRKQAAEPDASETQLLTIDLNDSGTWSPIEIRARMSQISPLVKAGYIVRVAGTAVLDSGTGSPGSGVNPFDDSFHNVHVVLQQISSNVQATLYIDGSNADSHTFSSATLPSQINTVHVRNSVVAGSGSGNFDEQSIIAINTTSAGAPSFSVSALYAGELVTDRLTRLAAEEGGNGLPMNIIGASTVTMGPQGADNFLALLRECESADQGLLIDGLSQGLTYICRSSRYSQTAALTIDASSSQVGAPFQPVDDDQRTRNSVTVSRKNGGSATAEETDGPLGTDAIGTYEAASGSPLNLDSDTPLPGIAAWQAHVGTDDEPYRYPTMRLDLAAPASSSLATDWLNTTPTERINVTNVSSRATQHPTGTIGSLLEGYSEELSPFDWEVEANCSPAAPWDVAVVSDTRFRVGSNQSTVSGNVSAGATSMTVVGHTWSTSTPYDVRVAGWKVTVTHVSGTTFTINPAPGLLPSGSAVTMWTPATVALA